MRPSFFALAGGLVLLGCHEQLAQHQAPAVAPLPLPRSVAAPVAIRPPAVADTTPPYTSLESGPTPVSPQVLMDGVQYQVQASAVPDSTRLLRYTFPPEAGEVNLGDPAPGPDDRTVQGVEVAYTFRLLRPDGRPQFTRQVLKSSLKKEMGDDLAASAADHKPDFLGYLPQFHALAFELDLTPPDSDAGGNLLLLLDATTGQVRQQRLSRWTGGCNSPVALSEDGRTLLTSFDIIQANGRITKLEKPRLQVGGTLLVNSQTVLITYLPDENENAKAPATPPRNARLLDLSGRPLAAFALENLDGGLGYHAQATYLGQTRTYYLFDDTSAQLGLLPHDQPTAMRVVKLNQLAKFQPPQRPTEVSFTVSTEGGSEGSFYVDTLSRQVRHSIVKP